MFSVLPGGSSTSALVAGIVSNRASPKLGCDHMVRVSQDSFSEETFGRFVGSVMSMQVAPELV